MAIVPDRGGQNVCFNKKRLRKALRCRFSAENSLEATVLKTTALDTIVSFCGRRGFVFPGSGIYGGLNSCWDYGPLGAALKDRIKRLWRESMTRRRDIVGLDSAVLMSPKVWEASGHLKNFTDPLSDCRDCKHRFLSPQATNPEKLRCPKCGSSEITEARLFNLLFKTSLGPVEGEASAVYLRPETAQGIYVNFQNVQKACRKTPPFGIAQIGKAFRNEITPSHFVFRMREFEQMEMQFFIPPEKKEADKWFEYWKEERRAWLLKTGLSESRLRFHAHGKEELAHYAQAALDIEYKFPMGFRELEGVHNRGDFDLSRHQEFSGKNLLYFDALRNKSFIPHVIETSIGCDRLFLALLCDAYSEEEVKGEKRVVLKLKKSLTPVQAAVLPLSKKEGLQSAALKIHENLSKNFSADYDESGSIGKRYRRQDEIGTPYCVTLDFESLNDGKATVRERDSMKQERLPFERLESYLEEALKEP